MSEDATAGRVQIRDVRNRDLRAIRRVAQTTWEHTYRDSIPEHVREEFVSRAYSDDSLRQRMESDVFLAALQDGNIVGFADFRPLPRTEAELAAIYVLPEMQGRGVGGRLLSTGIARFAAGTRFVLRVERGNEPAVRFYEARGFRRSGESTEALLGHEFHDVEMILDAGA